MIARRVLSTVLGAVLTAGVAAAVMTLSASGAGAASALSGYALGFGNDSAGQVGSGVVNNGTVTPTAATLPPGVAVVQVAAGYSHTVALGSDGIVYAWGSNSYGELGNGSTKASALPLRVNLPSGVSASAVAAGYFDSFAVTTDGAVYAWGYGGQGELGDGATGNAATPVLVHLPAGVQVRQVAAGYAHVVAVTGDGSVYTWGANTSGQLGDGTITARTAPVAVTLPAGVQITAVAAGYAHSLALASTGAVYAWGANGRGQLGDDSVTPSAVPVAVELGGARASGIAAGYQHSMAILSDGSALAWGDNSAGQLGTGQAAGDLPYAITPTALALAGQTVTQVAAGYAHTLLLTAAGDVLGAGDNSYGELGTGDHLSTADPVAVALPPGSGTVAVAAASTSLTSFVITPAAPTTTTVTTSAASAPAGQPVTFTATVTPSNGTGALTFTAGPAADPLPGCHNLPLHRVSSFTYRATCSTAALPAGVCAVAAGFTGGDQYQPSSGTLPGGQGITAPGGAALAWGGNTSGQLGDGTLTDRPVPVPAAFPAGTSITQLAGGIGHSLALLSDGSVYAWGDNTYGELGDGTTTSSTTPVRVALPAGVRPVSVAAGGLSSAAVTADGTLYTWGENNVGQLGDGTTTNSDAPQQAALPTGVVATAVAVGGAHLLVLTSTGAIYAAGGNTNGQLGDNSVASAAIPVPVHLPAGSAATGIAAGAAHSLAVTVDDAVLAWGNNSQGQLGTGDTTAAVVPVPADLPANSPVVQVAAGSSDSLALTAYGGIVQWGDGATTASPVTLPAGTRISAIAAASTTGYGLTSDGALLAWGDNSHGQLGTGDTSAHTDTVAVQLPSTAPALTIAAAGTGTSAYTVVPRLTTGTNVTTSANPITAGTAVTFTATVSPTDGGGTVSFTDGGTPLEGCAAATLAGSGTTYTATCTTSTLPGGTHNIAAHYSGDALYTASSAALAGGQTVTFLPTSTKISTSAAKIRYTKVVTFTAKVTGTDGSGTVAFLSDGAPIPGCANEPLTAVFLGPRQATCRTTALPPGQHAITADYSGTWRYAPSSATLAGGELVQATTALTASPVKITAPDAGPVYRAVLTVQPDGTPLPGMTVTFTLNALYGSSTCTAVTDANGVATCQGARPKLSGGQYTAKFAGTTVYLASTGKNTVAF